MLKNIMIITSIAFMGVMMMQPSFAKLNCAQQCDSTFKACMKQEKTKNAGDKCLIQKVGCLAPCRNINEVSKHHHHHHSVPINKAAQCQPYCYPDDTGTCCCSPDCDDTTKK